MARKFISNVKGVGIKDIYKQYYLSSSLNEPQDGEWSDTVPTITEMHYLWSRWKAELTNGYTETTSPVREGIAGEDIERIEDTVSEIVDVISEITTKIQQNATKIQQSMDSINAIAPDGVVPIEHGGTNAKTAETARASLGIGGVATEDILPISKGGTEATSVADARTNLGIYKEFVNGTLWTSENVSSDSDCSIIVIPFLRLCFMRAFIKPKRNFVAYEQYGVITVPEAYRPAYTHSLSAFCTSRAIVKARVAGETGYVHVVTDVDTNYEMYISGMWYY